ncbi:AraC family transcriptional regulator [Peptoniphilus sp. MSJ-1]|uniref:AraC family transcriptional regulator n=1 Tax=Peptoniphilus ovalis TaxID=2841503 RepID=A0ABS6FFL6_9FIRM|nr:AraC family transcriptional regulator [Peptoniphilus ovalis]MBU5668779.1 AraC family transcriptional regulator [Peptoniphilus ovalis]
MKEKHILVDENNMELPIQLKKSFPIGIYHSRFCKEKYNMVDYHWHKEFQFALITRGSFIYKVGNIKYELFKDDLIFINTNQIHKTIALEENSSYIFIYFNPDILSSDKDSYIYKNYVEPLVRDNKIGSYKVDKSNDFGLIDLIRETYEISKSNNEYFELDLVSNLFKIWKSHFKILKNINSGFLILDPLINSRLRSILNFISINYDENISLDDIAEYVNLSKSECSRFFKKYFQENLFDYLLNYRINKSVDLILNSNKSITDIAFSVGFNSQSYFISKFKNIKGITPLKMRKEFNLSREKYFKDYKDE